MPTYPSPVGLSDSAAEALHGTTDSQIKIAWPAIGTSPASSPSLAAQWGKAEYHLAVAADSSLRLMARDEGALNVGVHPGFYRKSDATDVTYAGTTAFALTDDATNYLYILHSTGALTKSTVGWPADPTTYTPIAIFVTASGDISTSERDADRRDLARFWTNSSSTSPTGTTGTTFTLDSDNSGAAGASSYVVSERGTDATGNAKLGWNETSDQYEAFSDDSGANYATVRIAAIDIGGATALDSNGAAKVAAAVAGDGLTHAAGVLAVNPDGSTLEISANQLQLKDAGITTAKLGNALADKLAQVSIGDASGASPQTCTIQMLDIQGNNLAESCYVEVGVFQDANGTATATNATIAVGGTGTQLDTVSANKIYGYLTNASGTLTVTITDGTLETVYVIARARRRSKILDCSDIGTITIS